MYIYVQGLEEKSLKYCPEEILHQYIFEVYYLYNDINLISGINEITKGEKY